MNEDILRKKSCCIIHPLNKLKAPWDFMIVFLLFYSSTYVPYRVCFTDFTPEWLFIFDLWVDFMFFLDILLTFFAAYENSRGFYVVKQHKIIFQYVRSHMFYIDVFTTIPF